MVVMLEQLEERQSPAIECPTDIDDAIIHMLSELGELDAATLAFEPLTLKRALRAYQAIEEPAELATLNERRNRRAAMTWSKLTNQEQGEWLRQTSHPEELDYVLEFYRPF